MLYSTPSPAPGPGIAGILRPTVRNHVAMAQAANSKGNRPQQGKVGLGSCWRQSHASPSPCFSLLSDSRVEDCHLPSALLRHCTGATGRGGASLSLGTPRGGLMQAYSSGPISAPTILGNEVGTANIFHNLPSHIFFRKSWGLELMPHSSESNAKG